MIEGEEKTYRKGMTAAEYTPWVKGIKENDHYVTGDFLSDYINSPLVRKSLNIPDSV